MREDDIMKAIMTEVGSRTGVKLFRNNIGMSRDSYRRYGIPGPGGSDLIGWVTLEFGGQQISIFCAIEVKSPGAVTRHDLLKKQEKFLASVQNSGGIAGFADSVEAANKLIDDYLAFKMARSISSS